MTIRSSIAGLASALCLLALPLHAQVGIGTATPNASAVLDLTSTARGFLPPRMTTAQRDAIGTPATGLVVYNTSTNALNVYNGTNWVVVGSGGGGGWELTGNALATGDFLGSTNAQPLPVRTNNVERLRVLANGQVGIGTTAPNAAAILEIASTTLGFLPPRMTTAQRDAIATPAAGLIVYNTSTNALNVYNGAWVALGAGGSGIPITGTQSADGYALDIRATGANSVAGRFSYDDGTPIIPEVLPPVPGALRARSNGPMVPAASFVHNDGGLALDVTGGFGIAGSGTLTGRLTVNNTTGNAVVATSNTTALSGTGALYGVYGEGTGSGAGGYFTAAGAVALEVDGGAHLMGQVRVDDLAGTVNNRAVVANTAGVISAGPVLATGTYTPTFSGAGNLTSGPTTFGEFMWYRIGNMVNVSGRLAFGGTASTFSFFRMTLPVASNLTAFNGEDCVGVVTNSGDNTSGIVRGDDSADAAWIQFTPPNAANRIYTVSFMYRVQ